MQISFATGTTHEDLLGIGIDPARGLACILAHNSGRDEFESFCDDAWTNGDFERVETWSRKLHNSPFGTAGWRQTTLLILLADLFDEGGTQSLDGCVLFAEGVEYLEAGDTYNTTITVDGEGVLRIESYGDMVERLEPAPVTSEEFDEGIQIVRPVAELDGVGVGAWMRHGGEDVQVIAIDAGRLPNRGRLLGRGMPDALHTAGVKWYESCGDGQLETPGTTAIQTVAERQAACRRGGEAFDPKEFYRGDAEILGWPLEWDAAFPKAEALHTISTSTTFEQYHGAQDDGRDHRLVLPCVIVKGAKPKSLTSWEDATAGAPVVLDFDGVDRELHIESHDDGLTPVRARIEWDVYGAPVISEIDW